MPQLQPGDFAPQLVWLAITFIFLFFALSRLALPRVERVIVERRTRISRDIEKARDAQKQAQEEEAHYEASLLDARSKAQSLIRSQREKLETEFADQRSVIEKEMAEKTRQTEESIQGFVERASSQLEAMTSEVVKDIVKELAGVDATDIEVQEAIRQSMKE